MVNNIFWIEAARFSFGGDYGVVDIYLVNNIEVLESI